MLKLGLAMLAISGLATPALADDIRVTPTGVKAKGGTVEVALYDEVTFLRAKPLAIVSSKVTGAGDVTVTLPDVAPGDYAIAAFHDADGNGAMTMGPDGRLAEGTALTNADKLRGPPTFAVARIVVPATPIALSLPMSYPEDRSGW